MALPCVRLHSRALCRFLCRSSSHQTVTATEEIDIPRKKTWDKTAVLQALAYTVNHDPTSRSYVFQDDPYLLPKSSTDYNLWPMSKESGRNSAKYIVNMYPNLFAKDIAEPHIPCLMPENIQLQIEGISEEALKERILLRRVKESVDLYDQLLQTGTPPSLETTNRLLDLLCFYGNGEPSESKENLDQEIEDANGEESPDSQIKPNVKSWRDDNNAERIFNLMPEKDEHSFRTMIRGMVKHGAASKAFAMYTDLLNNRLTGDVHTFNALIKASPKMKSDSKERWALVVDLLHHMIKQNVRPNVLTFNAILISLHKSGLTTIAMQTVNEMRALKIEPSLATFSNLLEVFYKQGNASDQALVLGHILQKIHGKSFTAQDPDDVKFFAHAIKVCLDAKDLVLAYKVDALKNTGDNWKLLGSHFMQIYYYGKLFNIICQMENIDVTLKWYTENIPSRYFPTTRGIINLLQAIEMENRFEVIPQIWQDMQSIGLSNRDNMIQEFLQVMKREKQNPKLQDEFANIAVSMKSMYETPDRFSRMTLSAAVLGDIAILLCRAGRMEEVGKTLKSFKSQNLIPRPHAIEELLFCAKESDSTSLAIDLVQLAVSYSLPNTVKLAKTVLDGFTLNEEQRISLQDLTLNSTSSSSSSSSDSDKE